MHSRVSGRSSSPRVADGARGQQLVELALALPFLLLILLGTLDLGRAFHTQIALTNAAREAARFAAVGGAGATSAQASAEFGPGGSTIAGCIEGTVSLSATGGGRGRPYTVVVTCEFQLVTPFMGRLIGADEGNRITIGSTATFVIE